MGPGGTDLRGGRERPREVHRVQEGLHVPRFAHAATLSTCSDTRRCGRRSRSHAAYVSSGRKASIITRWGQNAIVIAPYVMAWNTNQPATTRRRHRSESRKISGEVSSAAMSTHWNQCSVHGTSSSHCAHGVPRRITARTIVAELTQSIPPKRSLAQDDRK